MTREINRQKIREAGGCLYTIGVGPGDPELLTLKAVRLLRECRIIAIPHKDRENCVAYQIARQAVPEIDEKICLPLPMPMTKDQEILEKSHRAAAEAVAEKLQAGEDVALITLGDPAVYSTGFYIQERMRGLGYETKMVSGITSFCAAAARLGNALVSGAEELHVIPASYQIEEALKLSGTKVFMKAGRQMAEVKRLLADSGLEAIMVENCGMEGERVYESLEEIPDQASYYSLLIAEDRKKTGQGRIG